MTPADATAEVAHAAPPAAPSAPPIPQTFADTGLAEEFLTELILKTLEKENGNRTITADVLGISVRTLRNKLAQYGEMGAFK